jgi:hypothetical protein
VSQTITGGDLAIWTAAIAGGSAVIAGLVGTFGGAWATSRTLSANSQLAREQFLREKQTEAYLLVANHMARVRAWANIAIDEAKGNPVRYSPKPEFWTGDEWFKMAAHLRVFGSLFARAQFDEMHHASTSLQSLVRRYEMGNPASSDEVDELFAKVNEAATRLTVVLSAELGPLNDELRNSSNHWWQFRKKKIVQRRVEAAQSIVNKDTDDSN